MAYLPLTATSVSTYPEAGYDPTASENVTDYESSTYVDPSLVQLPGQAVSASAVSSTAATSTLSTGLMIGAAALGLMLLLHKD